MKLGGKAHVERRVALVRRDQGRLARAAQQVGDLIVAGAAAGARVDDEHCHIGVGEADARLLADRSGERILIGKVDAAGVDQRECTPVPLAVELFAVARDPRPLVHDRLTRLCQAVDERGLANVWVADYCNLGHVGQYDCAGCCARASRLGYLPPSEYATSSG